MRFTVRLSELLAAMRWAYAAADDPFQESIARSKERIYALMRRARDAEEERHALLWRALAEEQLDHVQQLESTRFKYFTYATVGFCFSFATVLWAVLLLVL